MFPRENTAEQPKRNVTLVAMSDFIEEGYRLLREMGGYRVEERFFAFDENGQLCGACAYGMALIAARHHAGIPLNTPSELSSGDYQGCISTVHEDDLKAKAWETLSSFQQCELDMEEILEISDGEETITHWNDMDHLSVEEIVTALRKEGA